MCVISLRQVKPEVKKVIKEQVIRLHEMGKQAEEMAEITNISISAVGRILSAYNQKGMACFEEKVRGRKLGEKRLISPEQEKELQQAITDTTPKQANLAFDTWTRGAIRQLIKERYDIDVALRTISAYLDRWGMTCQRPAKRAYRQDKKKCKFSKRRPIQRSKNALRLRGRKYFGAMKPE